MVSEKILETLYGGTVSLVFNQIITFFYDHPTENEIDFPIPFSNDNFFEFLLEKLRTSGNDFQIERSPDMWLYKTMKVYRGIPSYVNEAWMAANQLRYKYLVNSMKH